MDPQNAELLDLLDLQSADEGVFLGPPSQDGWIRVFGGQVLAQALAAASFTVEDWACHSLHAYFLRPGKPGRPIEYEVSSMRDGSTMATRNVVAVQRDEVNLQMVASFQAEAPGAEHQVQMPDTPPPESFPPEPERMAKLAEGASEEMKKHLLRRRPLESIRVDPVSFGDTEKRTAPTRTWMRTRGELIDDPNLHRCVLAYASDMGALEPCLRAIGGGFGDSSLQVASLDHAIWFHRPFRIDDWLLFVFDSASVAAGRGLTHGQVFDRQGRLVASIAQEGLMRGRD
ncbi:MAG: thioesterase family protein [Myxococcales bacterium]|nr:thioesterase family protein [Myxococcales bacterium]